MWTIQEELLALSPIVHNNRKTSGSGDHKLLKLSVSVTAARCSCGDIIKVVDAPEPKRDVAIAFDEREIPPSVRYFREIDDAARLLLRFYALFRCRRDVRGVVLHFFLSGK